MRRGSDSRSFRKVKRGFEGRDGEERITMSGVRSCEGGQRVSEDGKVVENEQGCDVGTWFSSLLERGAMGEQQRRVSGMEFEFVKNHVEGTLLRFNVRGD